MGKKTLLLICLVVWLVLLSVGFFSLTVYKLTAGTRGVAPTAWPAESPIPLDKSRLTLAIFLHPRCPCSRASLSELNIILNAVPNQVATHIVFFRPPKSPDGSDAEPGKAWERTGVWDDAGRIRETQRRVDLSGLEAQRFGAGTSGHVVLYGPGGELRFAGGITSSRGHAGDNIGRREVLKQISERQEASRHAVFGCPLAGSDSTNAAPRDVQ